MPASTSWRRTMALFAATSLVESLAFGHLSAFTPLYLRELRVAEQAIPFWTGLLSALAFVIGFPLLPFWGIWADKYGRKLIIVRSSIFAALIYGLTALCSDVYQLAAVRLLGGFVFGNTGVMMAMQADLTPREKLGSAVAIISAGSPVGMAIGPYLGGLVVHRWGIRDLLLIDTLLTALVVIMLILLLREQRPEREVASTRHGLSLALSSILHTPRVGPLFLVVFLLSYGVSLSAAYVPILVHHVYFGPELAVKIGGVLTASGLAMAIATPLWGPAGDKRGHLRMLRACAAIVAVALAGQAISHTVLQIGAWRLAQGLCQGGFGALSMVLLALYCPPDRRSTVLNLSLLPQQLAWFLGPLTGSGLSSLSIYTPFWIGAASITAGLAASFRLPPPEEVESA